MQDSREKNEQTDSQAWLQWQVMDRADILNIIRKTVQTDRSENISTFSLCNEDNLMTNFLPQMMLSGSYGNRLQDCRWIDKVKLAAKI
uniref:Uncharacterized protein n=1 Tax=Arion vulgaris TaxID=1028688 RepID=A0A0B6YA66_9EUPU